MEVHKYPIMYCRDICAHCGSTDLIHVNSKGDKIFKGEIYSIHKTICNNCKREYSLKFEKDVNDDSNMIGFYVDFIPEFDLYLFLKYFGGNKNGKKTGAMHI